MISCWRAQRPVNRQTGDSGSHRVCVLLLFPLAKRQRRRGDLNGPITGQLKRVTAGFGFNVNSSGGLRVQSRRASAMTPELGVNGWMCVLLIKSNRDRKCDHDMDTLDTRPTYAWHEYSNDDRHRRSGSGSQKV